MHIACRSSRGVGHGTACARNRFLAEDDSRYSQYSRFLCSLQPKCAVASRNPLLPSHPPTTPFEKIFADYFGYAGRHFLIVGENCPVGQMCLVHLLGPPSLAQMHLFASFDHTLPLLEKKFPQMVGQSLLPSSHRILCASGTSNTASPPPTFPNPTAAWRLQSKSLKGFSCPILALMGI